MRECAGIGPGTVAHYLLARAGVYAAYDSIHRKIFGVPCPCPKNARNVDEWWLMHWSAKPLRAYLANYAANVKWLRAKLALFMPKPPPHDPPHDQHNPADNRQRQRSEHAV